MSTAPALWKEQRLVESFEVDMNGRLKPHVLFAYLTNAAWKHASLTAHGYDGLSALNQMWVLVKFQLSIKRLPRWGEQITIETWGKGTERLYALRDYSISLVDGEKLASATSGWLILDKDRRRPVKVDRMIFPWETGRIEMETDLQKVPKLANGRARGRFRAFFSDIDVNHHVTAMKYLQWMMDSHAQAVLRETQPRSIELSFLAEAVIDDEVTVYSEVQDGFELCSVMRDSDETELCRARIAWE